LDDERADIRARNVTLAAVVKYLAPPPPGMRIVLMSDGLFNALGVRVIDWGVPDEHGWYTPTLYRNVKDE
jgi:hypothetical protein